jgi:glutamate--cysteine ligase catalytic subunit
MSKAQKRSATLTEKFWFRKNITKAANGGGNANGGSNDEAAYKLMSIDEIINGKTGEFPGLIPYIHSYLSSMEVDTDTHCTVQQYLKLISRRASGQIDTTASWIRRFVQEHPAYRHDSIINDEINYDLLMTADGIQSGRIACPRLLGDCLLANSKTKETIPPAVQKVYPSCTP